MKIKFDKIKNMDKINRLNLINSVVGIKPVVLVGTIGLNKVSNLAIFSSLVHMGSNPPLLALNFRPVNNTKRHTYENIIESKFFSINHINKSMIDNAHLTSLKFPKEISEFENCNIEMENLSGIPFVKKSPLKMLMKFKEEIIVKTNNCRIIISEIKKILTNDNYVDDNFEINYNKCKSVSVGSLNTYYSTKKIKSVKYLNYEQFIKNEK